MARRYFRTGGRSLAFTAKRTARSYALTGIDVGFWRRVQAKCKAEGVSVRAKILGLLSSWLEVSQ